MIIREVEKPDLKKIIKAIKFKSAPKPEFLSDVLSVGSGKGGIAIILQYLKEKGVIINKLDEVMVPDWLGYWVYNQIQPFAFPAKKISDRTKVLFVYHQYGFPQDMDKILEFAHDKKLIVIEDCAHALNSYYKGKLLGSMGDFAIYSFSKWFFCFALGGIRAKAEDFYDYADGLIKQTPFGMTFTKDVIKFFYERSTFSTSKTFKKYMSYLLAMSYSLYGESLKPSKIALKFFSKKIENEINVRQRRYHYFFEKMRNLGICDHLEEEGVTPYIMPIRCSESKSEEVLRALQDRNIATGLYNFDINRNLLSPNFVPCIWVPCHSGISDEIFNNITDTIFKSCKNKK
ncbi:MAG: DegT/DnrJ/EryC1/StrS family aminotransferase [Patescibacteria group bacterium]|nr:DegT/DnrJ/EryC1/StrS family aminotransferase [Patescibacteria group bacterium]MDD5295138.1 DegT/DnrJ/EryC1/StrS family aminotransferase [Patescibacteria group bacterium]